VKNKICSQKEGIFTQEYKKNLSKTDKPEANKLKSSSRCPLVD